MRARFVVAALMMLGSSALAAESVYTPTHGPVCKDAGSKNQFSIWRCPGPGSYAAEFSDEGNMAGFAIGRGGRRGDLGESVTWRGAGAVFGDKLEWRLANGKPVAAILRTWRVDSDDGGNQWSVQELLVVKLAPNGACRVGAIDVRQVEANRAARQLADTGTCTLTSDAR
jgi:hypothetical protein